MQLNVEPGTYVVAVSGGVDSVVLLDILAKQKGLQLVVAHFDHGMRPDSGTDRQFVQKLAEKYSLPFVDEEGHLGAEASEAKAREARYSFLRAEVRQSGAKAVITAHHQDDLLETAILNMLRGTGRKGLTALKNQSDILRPLLGVPKSALQKYAQENHLEWREDPTNKSQVYLRNYIRHKLLPKFSGKDRAKLLDLLSKTAATNQQLDSLLGQMLSRQPEIERVWFNQLPHAAAREMMAAWLRQNNLRAFDSKTLERLVTAAKTATAGKQFPVIKGARMKVGHDYLALEGYN